MATTLTPRQRQIKKLLDQKKTTRQIADQLGISENGVHQHKRRMGVTNGSGSKSGTTSSRRRSGSNGSTRTRTRATGGRQSRSTTPRPAPAPAPAAPAHVTPLQSVRHRRDEITHELRDVRVEHEQAVKAAEKAAEVLAKAEARYADELNQLDAAEAALTGKVPEPAKPSRQASRSRNGSGKGSGKASGEKAAESAPAPAGGGEATGGDPGPDGAAASGGQTPPEAVEQDAAAEAPDQEFERPGVPTDPEFEQGAEAVAAFEE